jgi:hypothetical protein
MCLRVQWCARYAQISGCSLPCLAAEEEGLDVSLDPVLANAVLRCPPDVYENIISIQPRPILPFIPFQDDHVSQVMSP